MIRLVKTKLNGISVGFGPKMRPKTTKSGITRPKFNLFWILLDRLKALHERNPTVCDIIIGYKVKWDRLSAESHKLVQKRPKSE